MTSQSAPDRPATGKPQLQGAGTERPTAGLTAAGDGSRQGPLPTRRLHVVAWDDPVVDSSGFDVLGAYVELFWLPVLGPSATLLLRRLAAGLRAEPGGFDLELDVAARALGLGGVGGRRSPFRRAILRCTRYGVARHLADDRLAVRRWLTALPERHLQRLPEPLQAQHRRWEPLPAARPATIDVARRRARWLALQLAAVDPERENLERRLVGHGVHPAVAYESAHWAVVQHQTGGDERDGDRRLDHHLISNSDRRSSTPTGPRSVL